MNRTEASLRMDRYIRRFVQGYPAYLDGIERDTRMKVLYPQMLSGPVQGQFLRFISLMVKPMNVLEIGTFSAYGTLCLAEGLAEGAVLHTLEKNLEIEQMARKHIAMHTRHHQIRLHMGDAMSWLEAWNGTFDLVFMDADKARYPEYYEAIMRKLQPGGWILADNVLWHGQVVEDKYQNKEVTAIRAFNEMVRADERVENVLLPFRDGMMMIRRKP